MKPSSDVKERFRKHSSSLEKTMKQIRDMEAKGQYRRIMKIDVDTYQMLQGYIKKHEYKTQTDAVVELIRMHRDNDIGVSGGVAEQLADFQSREHQGFTVFLTDQDFDYLKMTAREMGFRKNSAHGLAMIAREML